VPCGPGDEFTRPSAGGGGFGDPLERDPAKVEADIHNGDVSAMAAKAIYGVVLGNPQETERERSRLRLERIQSPSGEKVEGRVKLLATENLAVKGKRWCCAKCSTDLGSVDSNYKAGCVRNDLPIERSNPIVGDPRRFIDPTPQFRQFCCPGCGLLVENEIAVAGDPVLKDVELRG
jgi:N-methylhydantoinase B